MSLDSLAPNVAKTYRAPIVHGVDVSGWQRGLDYQGAAAAGHTFAWVKASQGNTNEAKRASEHVKGFSQAGLAVGVYHFAGPGVNQRSDDPEHEAAHFAGEVDDLDACDLRPVLDYETRWTRDRDVNMAWVLRFAAEFERLVGVTPMLYSGASLLDNRIDAIALRERGVYLWVADYRARSFTSGFPECDAKWSVWQYTSSIRPEWARGGRIDHNICAEFDAIKWRDVNA